MYCSKWFWHPNLPKKISICIGKAKYKFLVVDNKIQTYGIILASKCDCCLKPKYETIDHVLCTREVARGVWSLAAKLLGINCM